ncbi:hypothetical protein [Streptomyces camelliae]|uniref:Uncharacterized protein n=1 Tax=Streptomyces camelliae TaxID=3004093 RepID=A0ABY7P5Y8_9ACTN|nr:hypothetical protein [Streptomyces sp. HUAS 2-6]WBO64241.1 hypothetical protein O1G22_16100 [Streptomyces sp. HUAS 2-6]
MDKEQRRKMLMEVHAERDRLLPLRAEATRTTIEMVRKNAAHVSDPDLVPYLNLAYILGVKRGLGEDQLLAFALSLANWTVAMIADIARFTGSTVEEVVDVYETEILAAAQDNDEEPA